MDAPIPGEREFESPPTALQILDFMDHTRWNWQIDEGEGGLIYDAVSGTCRRVAGFKYVEGRVCRVAWKRRTGRAFEREVPREYLDSSEVKTDVLPADCPQR